MVLHLSRSQIAPQKDPHDWNTRDHYITIHESRLREHPFVVNDTLAFTDEGEGVILLRGACTVSEEYTTGCGEVV